MYVMSHITATITTRRHILLHYCSGGRAGAELVADVDQPPSLRAQLDDLGRALLQPLLGVRIMRIINRELSSVVNHGAKIHIYIYINITLSRAISSV